MEFFKKVLKVALIVILAVVIIYLVVGIFLSNSTKSSGNYESFGKMVSSGAKASTTSSDATEVNLDKVLINLRSGKYQYMKADMTFNMADEDEKEKLLQNMPRIRDTILRYSATLDSDQLATAEGKEQFKKDIRDILSDQYGYKVDAVYFRNFVLAQ